MMALLLCLYLQLSKVNIIVLLRFDPILRSFCVNLP